MSQPASEPAADEVRDDATTLSAGTPGPSGTGERTDAGADPDAPAGGPADRTPGGTTGATTEQEPA